MARPPADVAADGAAPRHRRGHGRATLRDVAQMAGVTAITVSRYLRQPGVVAPETAAAIRAALSATGYVPNKQAGVLASGRGSVVAALVPNLAHSIFAETLQGLSRKLEAAGLELLVAASGYSVEREEAQVRALLGWAPRALVITGRHHTPGTLKLLREAQAGGCTVVEMWDHHARSRDGFPQVGFNHRDAGRELAEHLLAHGRRRLVYVDSAVAGDYRARERGDGFLAAAQAAGAQVWRVEAPAGEPIAAGRAALVALWGDAIRRPDACACANDHLGCGALLGAQALGLQVPQDMALVGFGDFELAAHLSPGLTTLAPPRQEIGERTADLVLGSGGEACTRIRVACPLVVRGSS
ncbi:LacI family DNA-binding transcriptional regulator [Rubrivivax albus]|uniref:LacI family DNA-binding transcriptional regulator n=1 Tax=Rubrivivax albus TaxID=2499835 RepID=A0A3S2VZ98_9BURK|nr:LacI family DNA-binding transcriptional regulator [Rubrivivax albus]RVT53798.1 LacI family DNA-binding transcriptional regulator [Rubrivivax albus]